MKKSSEMINRSVRFSQADLVEAAVLGLNVNKVCRNAVRKAVRDALKSRVSIDELHRAAYEAVMEEKIKATLKEQNEIAAIKEQNGVTGISEEMSEDREASSADQG